MINRFFPFEAREDKGALFENLIISAILKRNLYARRPFNAYFWRTYQGYEIDLVLESSQTQELWGIQVTTGGKSSFSQAFGRYRPSKTYVVKEENAYRFAW